MTTNDFIQQLASSAPVPGGGGASALVGGMGVALCAMVANLTSGKKKYQAHQTDIETVLQRTDAAIKRLLSLVDEDAVVFEPLSRAYGLPKDEPNRAEIIEAALVTACTVPMNIMREIEAIADVLHILAQKGTKLAISDVGVAATALRAGIEGAALNVYINTKLMKNRQLAQSLNQEAQAMAERIIPACQIIYAQVMEGLVTS